MSAKTLFFAWQDNEPGQAWFPVGRLDADVERPLYRFRYIGGATRAQEEAGFPLLIEFPKLDESYESSQLFPLFQESGDESCKTGLCRLSTQSRPE